MKMLIGSAAAVGLVLGVQTAFAMPAYQDNVTQAPEPKEVVVSINGAYIPSGFDSSSDTFAVVNGMFPNTCYEWKEARVAHPEAMLHEIRSIAVVKPGICMMVLVPFTHEVELGRLEKGSHTLRFMNGDGTYLEKNLTIN